MTKLKCPAKINVGLRILSKRKDGFHNIETIYFPVKLYDELDISIKRAKKTLIDIKGRSVPSGKDNICYKAAKYFFEEFVIVKPYKIKIRIKKNIPTGAGLGGGSSDAASVIKYMAKYFKKTNKSKKLLNIAEKTGSDVTFFLNGKAAYGYSKGEKLKTLNDFKIRYRILLVFPRINISTKETYNSMKTKKSQPAFLNRVKRFDLKNIQLFVNNFEKIIFKKYPDIKDIKDKMYFFRSIFSLMSGSGSSVYGFFKKSSGMEEAAKYFRKKGFKVFLV